MGEKDFVLSKSDFVWIMDEFDKQRQRVSDFNDALDKICDGFPVFDSENGYLNGLLFALRKIFEIAEDAQINTLDWYLYDGINDTHITQRDELMVDVQGYGMLYELLLAEYYERKEKDTTLIDEFYNKYGNDILHH